ncbi:ATP-binding protein [Alcanivorax sp. DP30]|uniref:ATP-binding protein n=1 Tax=Alcanivorax sp. DP30 TaxID=2606217 RepID=UPI001367AC92|nr:ATP-binding protein [Alcanivorax sp. DP30]MZR63655.1 HAMP domain-containing protein [Alcanivorax sp. DP30]
MTFSIRRFLVASILIVILGGGLLLGILTYRTIYHELDEQYDAELVQSAHLLAGFWQDGHPPEASLSALDSQESRYLRYFIYQLWQSGKLVSASEGSPESPLVALNERPHYEETKGWHAYSLPLSNNRWLILAESDYARHSMVKNVAGSLLAPYLISVPFVMLLVWLAIRLGLSPLSDLARSVSRRSTDNLTPLTGGKQVRELEPVKEAINALLQRLDAGIEREKRFTADAAHELRTLLMVLRLHAENARSLSDPQLRDESLQGLQEAVGRAERMLEQLLVLARLDPAQGPPEQGACADILRVARDTLASLVPLGDRFNQQLVLCLEESLLVAMPEEALQLVLRNLIDNACRYASPGVIQVNAERQGRQVSIEISDSGEGLSEEQWQRYRERFSRGHSDSDGAGLGLSIVNGLLSLYGGSLTYRKRCAQTPAAAIVLLPAATQKPGL